MTETNNIGHQIHSLSNLLHRRLGRAAALHSLDNGGNITRTNGWILGYLARHEGQDIFQRDIENFFTVRRSTVSKVLRLMEEKGLIRRESVACDARLKKIVLTPEGRAAHERIHQEIARTEALLRQNVTEEELNTFFRVMEKFITNIQ